jgi:hypothetical protein
VEKQRAVEEINERIKWLESNVDEHKATAARLTEEIAEHEKKTSAWHDDVRPTNEVRQYNREEWYNQQHGDGWYNGGNWNPSTDGWRNGWQRGDAAAEEGRGVQRFDNNYWYGGPTVSPWWDWRKTHEPWRQQNQSCAEMKGLAMPATPIRKAHLNFAETVRSPVHTTRSSRRRERQARTTERLLMNDNNHNNNDTTTQHPDNHNTTTQWQWYKDSELLETGMKAEDDHLKVYKIAVEPFKATILKMWVPASETVKGVVGGRFDAMISEDEIDPDTVRAISALKATTTQSSAWSAEYSSAANIMAGARLGFFNGKDNYADDYWFSTRLPGSKLHEVKSMVFQKLNH